MAIVTEAKTAGTKLTPFEYNKLQKLVKIGMYLSISDFMREAIREKLEAIEIIKVKDIDYKTAKKEILGYYQKYSEAYPHEVAEDLEFDYEFVSKIINELKKEKRLGVIK